MNRFRQRDFWLWTLAVVAVILNAALDSYNFDGMVKTQSLVLRTQTVQAALISLLSDIKDAETGHRGYLLTSEAKYLEPFHRAEKSYPALFDTVRELTADNPAQQDRMAEIILLIEKKFREMHRTIELHDRLGKEAAANGVSDGYGKDVMDRIRTIVSAASQDEYQILQIRNEEAKDQILLSRIASFAAAAMAIGIILIAAWLIQTELRRRRNLNEALTTANEKLELSHATVKVSEARYRDLSDHLERLVQDRTADLKEQSALLQSSNEELEKFAYIASHDLQEPLRKIQSFGDRLLRKQKAQLDVEGQDAIDRMLDAAGRMRRLIEDLLAFSRVSTKVKPFDAVKLNDVLTEVVSTFDVHLDQVGGRITFDSLPTVTGDPSQLRQLFQNLLGNAIKFAKPEQPPMIHIGAVNFRNLAKDIDPPKSAGQGWRVEVRDNGIGFEQKYADRIFELFQRLHGRNQYEGTGLGLAICKKIAQRHGIALMVRSQPGEGTTFYLDCPIRST